MGSTGKSSDNIEGKFSPRKVASGGRKPFGERTGGRYPRWLSRLLIHLRVTGFMSNSVEFGVAIWKLTFDALDRREPKSLGMPDPASNESGFSNQALARRVKTVVVVLGVTRLPRLRQQR